MLSLFCLCWQVLSDLPVLISAHKPLTLFFPFFGGFGGYLVSSQGQPITYPNNSLYKANQNGEEFHKKMPSFLGGN